MPRKSESIFHEEQRFRQWRTYVLLAIPPLVLTALFFWKVVLGHSWGTQPLSNGRLIGWTIFLWLVYLRLATVRLVTDVHRDEISLAMRGLWRSRRIPAAEIKSVQVVTFDAARDFGGYGIRSTRDSTAYIAAGNEGVRIELTKARAVIVGSGRAHELARVVERLQSHGNPGGTQS